MDKIVKIKECLLRKSIKTEQKQERKKGAICK